MGGVDCSSILGVEKFRHLFFQLMIRVSLNDCFQNGSKCHVLRDTDSGTVPAAELAPPSSLYS